MTITHPRWATCSLHCSPLHSVSQQGHHVAVNTATVLLAVPDNQRPTGKMSGTWRLCSPTTLTCSHGPRLLWTDRLAPLHPGPQTRACSSCQTWLGGLWFEGAADDISRLGCLFVIDRNTWQTSDRKTEIGQGRSEFTEGEECDCQILSNVHSDTNPIWGLTVRFGCQDSTQRHNIMNMRHVC